MLNKKTFAIAKTFPLPGLTRAYFDGAQHKHFDPDSYRDSMQRFSPWICLAMLNKKSLCYRKDFSTTWSHQGSSRLRSIQASLPEFAALRATKKAFAIAKTFPLRGLTRARTWDPLIMSQML